MIRTHLALLALCTLTFMTVNAGAAPCDQTLKADADAASLAKIRKRLEAIDPQLGQAFDYKMLDLPTVAEARKRQTGLTTAFLNAVSSNAIADEKAPVIPMEGAKKRQFVRVYRLVNITQPLEQFDINMYYKKKHGNPRYDWRGDFVTNFFQWVWVYGAGTGHDVLLQYLVPAELFEIDLTMSKQEPYYVLSKEAMNKHGITNVGVFLEAAARVDAYRFEDPNWEPDPRFFNGPPTIDKRPTHIDDPKIHWMSADEIEMIVRNGDRPLPSDN